MIDRHPDDRAPDASPDDSSPDGASPDDASLDCATAVRMLWDYLDGQLGDADEQAVRAHVDRCRHCLPHHQFGELLLSAIASQRERGNRDTDATLRASVLARLRSEGYDGR